MVTGIRVGNLIVTSPKFVVNLTCDVSMSCETTASIFAPTPRLNTCGGGFRIIALGNAIGGVAGAFEGGVTALIQARSARAE